LNSIVEQYTTLLQTWDVFMSHPVYIFIRQTASTTNKSKNKTNAGDRWTASLSNTQPLLELITGYGKTPIATGW